ncbi:MAG: energy-coupling factor ABC transporter ATP-binding protein, partial [Pseudomonadota bacterium]
QVAQISEAILARFGREHWKARAVHSMSEGQRHLVCLMSVLAMKPDILLLDEPYAGLDMPTQIHLARLLEELPQKVVQISHQISTLERYDRVIWLEAGAVVADGNPGEVLATYREKMTELGQGDALADH